MKKAETKEVRKVATYRIADSVKTKAIKKSKKEFNQPLAATVEQLIHEFVNS